MDELPEVYHLETVEQMRAISDELRMRISEMLTLQPLTVTQLGAQLHEPPAKIHYHVRELERVGLVKLVETREKGGILEKYYRAIAKTITVPGTLLGHMSPDEGLAAANEFLQIISQGFLRTVAAAIQRQALEGDDAPAVILSTKEIWATPDELKELQQELRRLLDPYATPRGIPGEREVTWSQIAYETQYAAADSRSGVEQAPSPAAPTSPTKPPRVRRVFTAGAMDYTRKQLEAVVAQGDVLDINVLGYCGFARDIPAELVDHAIVHFRCRGRLNASDAVREVLARKGQGV
jgi:hypothetical protein